jgi:integrase
MGLTSKKIGKLVAEQAIGRHPDGTVKGLYLQIASAGAASWILRYERDGHERMLGIGPLDIVTLKAARERAKAARLLLLDGVDPIDARKTAKAARALEAAKAKTFKECAEAHFKSMESGWRSAAHAREYIRSLERYAFPEIGALSVGAIDTGAVMRVIKPIWEKVPETAARLRQRVEAALDWATVMGYRTGDNPARWSGHIEHLLPARNGLDVKHHPALPYAELPAFMAELRQRDGVAGRALEFTILVAARTGSVTSARWREIDLDAGVWTIPGEHMKGGEAHRVPLSPAALALLKALPGDKGPDSPAFARPDGRALARGALQEALAGLRDDITVHGFRSTFRDWAAEQASRRFSYAARELALAHVVHSQQSRAYERTDLLDERAELMKAWATFCYSPPVAGEVVPLRKAAQS